MISKSALTISALSALSLAFSASVRAQQHVHDQGEVFISQDNNQWLVMFTLPAVNALGFEHAPETPKELTRVKQLVADIERATPILKVDEGCSLDIVEHNLADLIVEVEHTFEHNGHNEHGHKHDHDEHNHDKHDHDKHDHDEHEHEHHDHDDHEESHLDVEMSFQYTCQSPQFSIDFAVFDSASGLETLDAQWITQTGQGAQTVTPNARTLALTSQ